MELTELKVDTPTFVTFESAKCKLLRFNTIGAGSNFIFLSSLKSYDRQKGHATALLTMVTEFADDELLDIKIYVRPYGKRPGLNQSQLVNFYKKFGFEFDDLNRIPISMVRKPYANRPLQLG